MVHKLLPPKLNSEAELLYVKEIPSGNDTITLQVEGRIDRKTLDSLKEVCQGYLDKGRNIHLQLTDLYYISKEGEQYMQEIHDRVTFIDLPQYLKLNCK